MTQPPTDQEPPLYAVRLAGTARDTLLRERTRQAETISPAHADAWYADMLAVLRSLATYPERCPVAPEDALVAGVTVRQRLHAQRRGLAWRLLFTVHDADADDPPAVRVHHIRHSAQSPLTTWPASDRDS